MKKTLTLFLIVIMSLSLAACGTMGNITKQNQESLEAAQTFYDKVVESKKILDEVATDVCSAWKDAIWDYNLSTKEVNKSIEKAKKENQKNINKITEYDAEISDLFKVAKNGSVQAEVKWVMTSYTEYRDSVLNANEALDSHGYTRVSLNKEDLDSYLQKLYVEL